MNPLAEKRWAVIKPLGLAGLVAAALFALSSCTPGSEITVQESDIVATVYDNKVDFGAFQTYAMPDTIVHIADPDNPDDISRENDAEILSLIASNFEARGYVRVYEGSPTPPDMLVTVNATTSSYWYYYYYYPWYPYWGGWWPSWGAGWGGYYPPGGGVSYAYSTGTLITTIADPNKANVEDQTVPVYWFGAINGVLDDTSASLEKRVKNSINQMFEQSPYLKAGS